MQWQMKEKTQEEGTCQEANPKFHFPEGQDENDEKYNADL